MVTPLRNRDLREPQYGGTACVASDFHRELETDGQNREGRCADYRHNREQAAGVVAFSWGKKKRADRIVSPWSVAVSAVECSPAQIRLSHIPPRTGQRILQVIARWRVSTLSKTGDMIADTTRPASSSVAPIRPEISFEYPYGPCEDAISV